VTNPHDIPQQTLSGTVTTVSLLSALEGEAPTVEFDHADSLALPSLADSSTGHSTLS
jgi:hypothetical protein